MCSIDADLAVSADAFKEYTKKAADSLYERALRINVSVLMLLLVFSSLAFPRFSFPRDLGFPLLLFLLSFLFDMFPSIQSMEEFRQFLPILHTSFSPFTAEEKVRI